MYQNDQIRYCEANITKTFSFQNFSDITDYIIELEKESKKDFLLSAEKSVVQPDYRTEALMKKGIHLGYVDILERLKRLVRG